MVPPEAMVPPEEVNEATGGASAGSNWRRNRVWLGDISQLDGVTIRKTTALCRNHPAMGLIVMGISMDVSVVPMAMVLDPATMPVMSQNSPSVLSGSSSTSSTTDPAAIRSCPTIRSRKTEYDPSSSLTIPVQ